MLLFLDVDGVLLGKRRPRDIEPCLAAGVDDFLHFALRHFQCRWLTSHCRGEAQTVIDYLRPYADASTLALLQQIAPSNYRTFKTEALHGDFLWVDDAPTAYEIDWLDRQGALQRWLQVNTREDFHALQGLTGDLQNILKHGFAD